MRTAAVALVALVAVACGGVRAGAGSADAALIEFDSNVEDAEVWIDGQFFAGALRRGVKVKPGPHRLEIRHDDYHTQYVEVSVAAGEKRTVQVRLAEILP